MTFDMVGIDKIPNFMEIYMIRKMLLVAASVLALSVPAMAEDAANGAERAETAFSRTIGVIKDWFGPAKPDAEVTETDTAAADDDIQVPPQPGVQSIEPAAGFDDDMLQVPPQYTGPQSNAAPVFNNSTPARATAFDSNSSVAAFNDPQEPSAADIANIAPAAGEDAAVDMSKVDCKAVLKAAESEEEGADVPDTAIVEACETPLDGEGEPVRDAAQPGFEDAPGTPSMPQPLPETQPAAGEPPIGGAVMPGEAPKK
ncbi:MAG: hypothetical protein EBQ96_00070 [Proteobacteria bacterium]|nr:hypothetical protein [Pseudomonadota bacterium]